MRLTKKRNGKNVIPLLNAVCGIDMPYWRIDRADDLHSYLSGDAVDKLAAYEDAEEQGLLIRLPCKVGDTVYKVWYVPCKYGVDYPDGMGCEGCPGPCDIKKTIYEKKAPSISWIVQTFCGPGHSTVFFLTRAEAEAALKGETDNGTT